MNEKCLLCCLLCVMIVITKQQQNSWLVKFEVLYYKCSRRSVLIPHQKLSKIVFYSSLTKQKGADTSS